MFITRKNLREQEASAFIRAVDKIGGDDAVLHKVDIQTDKVVQMIEITNQVQAAVLEERIENGIILVYCPHTTAGITINENADPDVVRDILMRLDEIYPPHTKNTDMQRGIQPHTLRQVPLDPPH